MAADEEAVYNQAQPHGAMLCTHDGTFQCTCDASKSHAMLCDAFSNMLVILLLMLEYLSLLIYISNLFVIYF